ncbi:MAG TPA: three-Cys-motif partner protein TcmP [Ktedonobacteraceae bacterium]|nr:three-Cys-motif partner protein TcmP [Ktedonobacteraceae bacterium]
MGNEQFFTEQTEQSAVKAAIISKYFWAWAKVIMPRTRSSKIAYIDLFAGPGRYKDGAKSTPLLILEKAIQDPDMRKMLVTIFNDVDENNSRTLESQINSLQGIETLKYKPIVRNHEVGSEIVKMFDQIQLVPTFFFVDPWGYKGLSLKLINSVLKNWGCDCIFFFNYNRIKMGLLNPIVKSHMDALFGEDRANNLRSRIAALKSKDKELTIVEELAEALKELGGKYVLPFGFKNDSGTRTTHHLIFVSKSPIGYAIMKKIMANESSRNIQGVASFEYSPADERQPLLFAMTRPLDDLGNLLLTKFAGCTTTLGEIFEKHNVGTPYIEKNYKDILRKLEAEGKIFANQPASERRKRNGEPTLTNVKFTFPKNPDFENSRQLF